MENTITEELIKVKYECYQNYLECLDEEYLRFEYCDHIGNEDGALDRLTDSDIINKLEDWCSNALFDDPLYHPINHEYLSACQGKQ